MALNTDATASTSAEASKRYPFSIRDTICEQLYLNPEMSDVQFVFPSKGHQLETGEQRAKHARSTVSIPAHKLILKTGSKVFREMFNGTWKDQKEVEIVDATSEAFKEFLQCFYLGSGQFTKENIKQVMYLANKYDIKDCLVQCVQFLKDSITLDDVCSGYGWSILYKQPELKEFCELKIVSNVRAVFNSDDFLDSKRDTLAEILKLNLICDEATIFDGCIKWAKNACKRNGLDENCIENLKGQLGDCNRYIQWTQLWWNENKIWRCVPTHIGSIKNIRSTETVQIASNKTTLLGGLHGRNVYNYCSGHCSTSASIEIIEKSPESDNVLFAGTIHFDYNNGASVKFAKPIVIKEGIKNEIRFGFKQHMGLTTYPMSGGKFESPKGLQIDFETKGNLHLISCLELLDVDDNSI